MSNKKYEVLGHGEKGNADVWEAAYAGDDTQCDTLEEAKNQMRRTNIATKLYRNSDGKCIAFCEKIKRVINLK